MVTKDLILSRVLTWMAKVTVFGEGPQGSLLREIGRKLNIFEDKMPQVFETAVKEVIEIPESSPFNSSNTTVVHSFGYPLGFDTKGGGFLYKMKDNRVSLGFVVGLEYEDPLFEPYQAFLSFKKHPLIADIIQGGKVLSRAPRHCRPVAITQCPDWRWTVRLSSAIVLPC